MFVQKLIKFESSMSILNIFIDSLFSFTISMFFEKKTFWKFQHFYK
jgi:hypothetical protein